MNTALDGSATVITPASTVTDAPSSFAYGDQIYEPRNYKEEYHGDVTLRYALAMSLNNATVKVAEEVGYDKVADLAKSAGIVSVKATPAMALGSYDAPPLDMAGAYTSFANNGTRLSPILVNSMRNAKGDVVANFQTDQRQVLDPRIAYVMTNMMEGVINNGLGYTAVRLRGFTAPAAGKTGSSHDGWFAGYTSNLLCIVWVGYDDYSDLRLSGAHDGRAHLDRVHEEGLRAAAVYRHASLLPAHRRGRRATRQSHEPPGDSDLSRRLRGRLRRRHRAARNLRPAGRGSGILQSPLRRRRRESAAAYAGRRPGSAGTQKEERLLRQDRRDFQGRQIVNPPPKPPDNARPHLIDSCHRKPVILSGICRERSARQMESKSLPRAKPRGIPIVPVGTSFLLCA